MCTVVSQTNQNVLPQSEQPDHRGLPPLLLQRHHPRPRLQPHLRTRLPLHLHSEGAALLCKSCKLWGFYANRSLSTFYYACTSFIIISSFEGVGPDGRLHSVIRVDVLQDVASALHLHKCSAQQKGLERNKKRLTYDVTFGAATKYFI